MPPIAVFVVDDHPVVREGLRMLVTSERDLMLSGSAPSVSAALPSLAASPPDVLLLDLDLGTEDGLALLPRIVGAAPRTRVLVLTGLRERERHQEALLGGACGLVGKDAAPELLIKAIRKVHDGELWFDRPLLDATLQQVLSQKAPPANEPDRTAPLTDRERRIVALVGRGLRNADIGEELGIAPKTVRKCLSAIYEKLGVADRVELLVYAYEHGLARRS